MRTYFNICVLAVLPVLKKILTVSFIFEIGDDHEMTYSTSGYRASFSHRILLEETIPHPFERHAEVLENDVTRTRIF